VSFSSLPLEVRLHIYDIMLRVEIGDHLNLLCASRQMYVEVRPSFYMRPLVCRSQYDLGQFTATQPNEVLHSITRLHLHMEEISSDLMTPYLTQTTTGQMTARPQHPYVTETERVTVALAKLPNLVHLQLLAPADPHKNLPSSIVMTRILSWVTTNYSQILSLRIHSEQCHIDSIAALRDLKVLHIPSYLETSSTRTAVVLGDLSNLQELVISGPPAGLQTQQRHGLRNKLVQSIDHQAFERIRPLKRLTIHQTASQNILFTSKLLRALIIKHQNSLQALRISSSSALPPMIVEFLNALLISADNLRDLSLTWPGMPMYLVDSFPDNIQRIELAVAAREDSKDIIDRLTLMTYRLQHLRHVTFKVINLVHQVQAMTTSSEAKTSFPMPFCLPIQNLAP
jgi:hypothetical protein